MLTKVSSCQSRLVKNETPYFLWTIKRDVIDYHSLSCDQMLNHYGKTASFTTKVSGGTGAGSGQGVAPCLLKCQRLQSWTAPWGAGHLAAPPQDWKLLAWPEAAWHLCQRRLALLLANLPRASASPTVSLRGPKATESLSSGLQGKPQTGPVTAAPTAWPGPWALGPGAALGPWGGGVGHPHLRCDFQLLGALPPTSHPHSLSATSHPRQPFPMYPEG